VKVNFDTGHRRITKITGGIVICIENITVTATSGFLVSDRDSGIVSQETEITPDFFEVAEVTRIAKVERVYSASQRDYIFFSKLDYCQ